MNKLTERHLIVLNEKIARRNGDVPSVRDIKSLKKVVEIPYNIDEEFFYVYKNKVDKAAVLGIEIVREKPFVNNNVATATLATLTFLELNGKKMEPRQEDVYRLQDLMRQGNEDKVVEWIKSHVK